MNQLRKWLLVLSAVLLTAGGFALAAPPTVSAEPGTGLAFGSFDISESDLAVTHAVLMLVKPARMYMGSSGEKGTVTYTNGEFFSPNLAPGVYSVIGFFSGDKFFALERGLRENTFEVTPGGVSYAGSYKLELTKGGLFRRDKGAFARVDNPETERQLLDWLAKELAPSGWAASVNARLAEK
ncbi:MAG TPA: hypothetical protein VFO35_20885 [Steroidobacteraceae bacterium]|nr:hypothetical protein [Steroidobacteraceae bacterium]